MRFLIKDLYLIKLKLTSVDIPDSVTSIATSAFDIPVYNIINNSNIDLDLDDISAYPSWSADRLHTTPADITDDVLTGNAFKTMMLKL